LKHNCQKLTEIVQDITFQATNIRNLGQEKLAAAFAAKERIEKVIETEGKEIVARKILGKDFLGVEEVKKAFNIEEEIELPPIPFSWKEIKRAKELGQMLILRIDRRSDGVPLTMVNIKKLLNNHTADGTVLLEEEEFSSYESFYSYETPAAGWALVSKTELLDTDDQTYVEQTDSIVDYLEEIYRDEMPEVYQKAISEYILARPIILKLLESPRDTKGAEILESLAITKLTRQSPIEFVYDSVVLRQNYGEVFMLGKYIWTRLIDSSGCFVDLGFQYEDSGVIIDNTHPAAFYSFLVACVSLSR